MTHRITGPVPGATPDDRPPTADVEKDRRELLEAGARGLGEIADGSLAERDHANIVSWSEFDRGGHWATHDAPDLLTGDIRRFFRRFR